MMPVAAVTLAQMWAVQVYAQLVLGRWQGEVGQNPPRRVRPHGSARSGSRAQGQSWFALIGGSVAQLEVITVSGSQQALVFGKA